MKMTLEQIKGMDIAVGTPIELTINTSIGLDLKKLPNNKMYKEIGYFQGLDEKRKYGVLKHNPRGFNGTGTLIPYIEEIKILKYAEEENKK